MDVELCGMPDATDDTSNSLNGKRVLVLGAGRTGYAVAESLRDRVKSLRLADDQAPKYADATAYKQLGLEVESSENLVSEITGFDLIVLSPGVPSDHFLVRLADAQGVEVIAEIELAYRLSPYPICAVTGTNGKSTVAALIAKMLQIAELDAVLCGNISADAAKLPLIAAVTAPPKEKPRILCAEISSFQLERCPTFAPMIGVLTTLGQDHLDRYNSVQGYWAAKRKMFANQSADQLAIHSADQPEQAELLAGLAAMQKTYSLRGVLSVGAFMDGGTLFLADNEYVQRICHISELQLIGRHNIANVLAASLAAYFAGAPVAAIRQASLEFQPLPHRLENVAVIRDVSYINNSMCTNPQAAVASLNAFSENLVVIAGGAGKNLDISPMLDGLARQAKYVILIGSEAEQVRNGLLRRGFNAVTMADSLEDAVLAAAKHAEAGDVVILNPGFASFDQFRDFEDRGEKFRRYVQSLAAK